MSTSGATLDLRDRVRDVPDFPEARDRLQGPDAARRRRRRTSARRSTGSSSSRGRCEPDIILGAEARGFIFGGALADRLGCGFVPARKPGKLPWETVEATYALEYGTDSLQVHADALGKGSRVIVHDDVLATGGTAKAKTELVEQLGGVVVGLLFVIELDVPERPRQARRLRRSVADSVLTTAKGCLHGRPGRR